MDIWEIDKLLIFLIFVIPGFISLKTYDLLVPNSNEDSSKRLIDAISYSCINYAILFVPIIFIEKKPLFDSDPILYALFYIFVVFVSPIIIACIWKKLRSSKKFQDVMPHPTKKPWDYVFSNRKCFWVIVELKDGRKIAGKYADKSFSSSYPENDQLYLEETWKLNKDGGFKRKRERSAGIIIVSDEISTIELFNMEE